MDATRSWHGMSVQCTQPNPILGHLNVDWYIDVLHIYIQLVILVTCMHHGYHMHAHVELLIPAPVCLVKLYVYVHSGTNDM